MTRLQLVFAQLTHQEAALVWDIVAGAAEDGECNLDENSPDAERTRLAMLQRIAAAMTRAMQ